MIWPRRIDGPRWKPTPGLLAPRGPVAPGDLVPNEPRSEIVHMDEEEPSDDLNMDTEREDAPMDQTMALDTAALSTKARGRNDRSNLEPTATGILDAGCALVSQDRVKRVRFVMDKTKVIKFNVYRKMKKVNDKNLMNYVDKKAGNDKNTVSYVDTKEGNCKDLMDFVDITEIYSPPRVNLQATKMGLKPGDSMDLVTGWDFNRQDHREMARNRIRETKPKILIGSPECKMFSTLQHLSPWTKEKEDRRKAAEKHLDFVCELYEQQVQEKRWFLHEHPVGAASWRTKAVQKIMKMTGVQCATADQCQYGLTTNVRGEKKPARKRTRFMSNACEVLAQLGRQCDGSHKHEPLLNNRAGAAAIYPEGLCKAICKGMKRQIEFDQQKVQSLLTLSAKDTVAERPELEEDDTQSLLQDAWDDTSGKALDAKRVREARRLEMQYVKDKQVWRKYHVSQLLQWDTKLSAQDG